MATRIVSLGISAAVTVFSEVVAFAVSSISVVLCGSEFSGGAREIYDQ